MTDTQQADEAARGAEYSEESTSEGSRQGPEGGGNGSEPPRGRIAEAIAALWDSISEARERGDMSAERAREALAGAAEKARHATSEARERFDFVTQGDFDELLVRVARLEALLGAESEVEESGGGEEAAPRSPTAAS